MPLLLLGDCICHGLLHFFHLGRHLKELLLLFLLLHILLRISLMRRPLPRYGGVDDCPAPSLPLNRHRHRLIIILAVTSPWD